jgi:hypothetical protein
MRCVQWCMNNAKTMMIGKGMPISHRSNPRPKPIAFSICVG